MLPSRIACVLALLGAVANGQSLLDRLDTTHVELRLGQARLDDWVERLRTVAAIDIDLDPQLQREATATTMLTEFRYAGSAMAVLDLIASIRPIHWEARGDRVFLYPAAVEAERRPVLVPHAATPVAAGGTDEQVATFVRHNVAPWSWTPTKTIATQGHTLLVRQSEFVHERIRHTLDRLTVSLAASRRSFDAELAGLRQQLLVLQRLGTIERLDPLTLLGTGAHGLDALGQIAQRLRAAEDPAASELARSVDELERRTRTALTLNGHDVAAATRLPKLALPADADYAYVVRVLGATGGVPILAELAAERWLSEHTLGRALTLEPGTSLRAALDSMLERSDGQLQSSIEHDAVVLRLRR